MPGRPRTAALPRPTRRGVGAAVGGNAPRRARCRRHGVPVARSGRIGRYVRR